MTPESQLETYRKALLEIASLADKTEVRGGLFDIGVPDHLVGADGFVPMPPGMQEGLRFAAEIARKALESARRTKA